MGIGGSKKSFLATSPAQVSDGVPDLDRYPTYFSDIEKYLETGQFPDYVGDTTSRWWTISMRFRRHATRAKQVGIDVLRAEIT